MSSKNRYENSVVPFLSFFEKALDVLKPPFMKLIVVFVFAVVTVILGLGNVPDRTSNILLMIFSCILFAGMALAYYYVDNKLLQYSANTEDELKKALRDLAFDRQREVKLIETIHQFFPNDREFRELFQHFQITFPNSHNLEYDSLGVRGPLSKVCGLVLYCYRHSAVDKLVKAVRELRPDASI